MKKIIITTKNKEYLDLKFLMALKRFLLALALIYVRDNNQRVRALNKYIKENVLNQKRTFSCTQLIIMGLNNLQIKLTGEGAIMEINPTAIVPYYTIKITDMCSFIDSGNLDIRGLHIFTYLFEYVKENMPRLRQMYEVGVFH